MERNCLLISFTTKFMGFFIKFWKYIGNKSVIIYTNILFSKIKKGKMEAENNIKLKLDKHLTFLHEAEAEVFFGIFL